MSDSDAIAPNRALAAALAEHRLKVLGAFHPRPDDAVPSDAETVLLIGPAEPGFWAHVTAQPEFADGRPDPLDRWSRRVIEGIARALDAQALFPFGGPPHLPFHKWALRCGSIWQSPIGLLVHETDGLFVSFRGALAVSERLPLAAPRKAPCSTCKGQPCTIACPVSAFSDGVYHVPACKAYLRGAGAATCMQRGCAARLACPVSAGSGRTAGQSAFHMRAFLE